jgi:hypothetical protein
MPRFEDDLNRLNRTVSQTGREYNLRLLQRSQAIFSTILNLLPSNYISAIQGPNYTVEIKAVSVELAKIELALEDIDKDGSYATTRSDFLYSIIGYLTLLNGRLPGLGFDDVEFRQFVIALIRVYFQGSIPESIREAASLFLAGNVVVRENFLVIRGGASGMDISDQFGFQIDLDREDNQFPADIFQTDGALRQFLDVIRPAHTLFRIRYVFKDDFHEGGKQIVDTMGWHMADYRYDDFRSYWGGVRDRDRLGKKKSLSISQEDHSADF